MIENQLQYEGTKAYIDTMRQALNEALATAPDDSLDPRARKIQEEAYRIVISEQEERLAEYEALREGRLQVMEYASLIDFPYALVVARVAAGLSVAQLAAKLGWDEMQLKRFEFNNYTTAQPREIQGVARELGVKLRIEVRLP